MSGGQGDLTVGLHPSWADLARAMGVTRQQVGSWRKLAGFPATPDEVAARLWHEEASKVKRRGPPMKPASEPSREVLEAMVHRRPRAGRSKHSDTDERKRLADAELTELKLAKERGQLISRAEADREAGAQARALLVEAEDLGERVFERAALPPAELDQLREIWDEEFGRLRDRLAGDDDPAAGARLVDRCLELLGDRVDAATTTTIRQALAEGLALFIPNPNP